MGQKLRARGQGSKREGLGEAQGMEGRGRRRATEGKDYRQTRRYEKGGGVMARGKKRRVNTQQAARIGMELYEWLVARPRGGRWFLGFGILGVKKWTRGGAH